MSPHLIDPTPRAIHAPHRRGLLRAVDRGQWARGVALGVALGAMTSAVAGCGGGSASRDATLNITVAVDPALVLQTVRGEVHAPGKDGMRDFVPMPSLRWTVVLSDLKGKVSVNISAKGLSSTGATVVTYSVIATAGPGESLNVPLKLSASCNPGPVCEPSENCEDGVCTPRKVFGTGTDGGGLTDAPSADSPGPGGTGGSAGVTGTGGATAATGGRGAGGASVATGGVGAGGATGGTTGMTGGTTATGGVGGTGGLATGTGGARSGGAPGTGGIGGSGGVPATGGRAGTGGASTGGASGTGGASSGGAPGTGGASTGGASATGGASSGGAPGTGGATVCNPGFYGPLCNYYFSGLGYPAPTYSWSQANAVSGDGTTVVGSTRGSSVDETAFRWQNGTMQSLGTLPGGDRSIAYAVNDAGNVVAGTSFQGITRLAFRWQLGGAMMALPLAEFGSFSEAHGISGDGVLIVGSGDNDGEQRSLRWTNGGVTTLGSVDPTFEHVVSRDGLVTGGSIDTGTILPIKRVAGAVTMLNTLPGFPSGVVLAFSSNGALAAGQLTAASAATRAVRWSGATAADLGALSGTSAQAMGISGDGSVVVGSSGGAAFMWNGTMRAVATVLTQGGVNLAGWQLTAATAVSANGKTIVGNGSHGSLTESWMARLP